MSHFENFYIYRYIRLDTNTPFYVGKGKGNRAFTLYKRNQYFKNIVNSLPYEVEIVLGNLTEEQALAKEIEFIKLYRGLGYCEANLTGGGEGSSGRIVSQITKNKISKSKIGHLVSQETRLKMSKSLFGVNNPSYGKFGKDHPASLNKCKYRKQVLNKKYPSKQIKVLCLNNSVTYSSITEASIQLNLDLSSILKVIKGKWKHTKGYKFILASNRCISS